MNAFTIRDLENLSGIKAHTIRIWEQRYSFLKPSRSKTNIRYYGNEELKTILNIALLNKYGFKISHINRMSNDVIREKIVSLAQSEAHQERAVNELLHYMIDLDTERFEEILDSYIRTRGIDKTINYLIFPFLDKIGILWVTDHVNIAQEHLVTNIIRQKLIMGIESASSHRTKVKTLMLFLPEGEHHELGLLYVHYLLRTRGINVLYLGADVPFYALEYAAQIKKPDLLYTHLTCIPGKFNFETYLTLLHTRIKNMPVVISGKLTQTYHKKIPNGISFKKSMPEAIDFLGSL